MAQTSSFGKALVKTWLFVAVSDACFASATGVFIAPFASPARVFRGVASVLLGKSAMTGGAGTTLIGLAMHFGVALFWSLLFVTAVRNSSALSRAIATWPTAILVASIYGVSIWLIMTWIVIPSMLHRPPNIGVKYWVQLVGHIPFVVMPMVLINRRDAAARTGLETIQPSTP
jgi:uncharacterized membrane protein YagU involved in acid resistance